MSSTYDFNDTNAWGAGGVPSPPGDIIIPSNTIIRIKTNTISDYRYGKLVIPSSSKLEFFDTDLTLHVEVFDLRGLLSMNARCKITVDYVSGSVQTFLWHNVASWTNSDAGNAIPSENGDIKIPQGRSITITTASLSNLYTTKYNMLYIPPYSELIIDGSVTNTTIKVARTVIRGSITTGDATNSLTVEGGASNIFLPVYLDATGKVQSSSTNAASVMDASHNFTMTCVEAKANTLAAMVKYKLVNNSPQFSYRSEYKTAFDNQLYNDIDSQFIQKDNDYFFNANKPTINNTLSKVFIQYIAENIFSFVGQFDLQNTGLISNHESIHQDILNSNLNEQVTNAIINGLSETSFTTNTIAETIYEQLKNEVSSRFNGHVSGSEYNLPFKAGDDIGLFIRLSSTIVAVENSGLDKMPANFIYDTYKNLFDTNNQTFLIFDDVNKTVKTTPTTWKIVINLA